MLFAFRLTYIIFVIFSFVCILRENFWSVEDSKVYFRNLQFSNAVIWYLDTSFRRIAAVQNCCFITFLQNHFPEASEIPLMTPTMDWLHIMPDQMKWSAWKTQMHSEVASWNTWAESFPVVGKLYTIDLPNEPEEPPAVSYGDFFNPSTLYCGAIITTLMLLGREYLLYKNEPKIDKNRPDFQKGCNINVNTHETHLAEVPLPGESQGTARDVEKNGDKAFANGHFSEALQFYNEDLKAKKNQCDSCQIFFKIAKTKDVQLGEQTASSNKLLQNLSRKLDKLQAKLVHKTKIIDSSQCAFKILLEEKSKAVSDSSNLMTQIELSTKLEKVMKDSQSEKEHLLQKVSSTEKELKKAVQNKNLYDSQIDKQKGEIQRLSGKFDKLQAELEHKVMHIVSAQSDFNILENELAEAHIKLEKCEDDLDRRVKHLREKLITQERNTDFIHNELKSRLKEYETIIKTLKENVSFYKNCSINAEKDYESKVNEYEKQILTLNKNVNLYKTSSTDTQKELSKVKQENEVMVKGLKEQIHKLQNRLTDAHRNQCDHKITAQEVKNYRPKENAYAQYKMAFKVMESGDFAAAVKLFTESLDLEFTPHALKGRLCCLIALGDYNTVLGCLRNVKVTSEVTIRIAIREVIKKANELKTVENMIKRSMAQEHYFRALQEIEQAIKIAIASRKLIVMKAECLVKLDRTEEALHIIHDLSKEGSEDADVHYIHGMCVWAQGEVEAAIMSFTMALGIDSGHKEAAFNLRIAEQRMKSFAAYTALYEERNFTVALKLLEEAQSMGPFDRPADIQILYLKALAYNGLQKYVESAGECSTLILLSQSQTEAYFLRAQCRLVLQDYEKAIEDLEKLVTLDDQEYEYYLTTAKSICELIKEYSDPYEVLGVTRNHSDAEINFIYRKLALQYHPDKFDQNPENYPGMTSETLKVKSQVINVARDVLLDPERRASFESSWLYLQEIKQELLCYMEAEIFGEDEY